MSRATFGLDKVVVERRPISAAYPFTVILPPPISVNAMYGNAPGRKRFHTKQYADWIEDATLRLRAAKPPTYRGQVWISIELSSSLRMDLDNSAKSLLDLLVRQHVIQDDSKKYLRELRLTWGNNAGAKVEVRPFSFSETRSAA